MVKSLHRLMFINLETSLSPGEMSQQQLERLIRKVLTFIDVTSIEGEDTTMVKGPNRIWSVDSHDKLKEYGFEIYGAIDAYSQFILDVAVSICNATEVAIMWFYLNLVTLFGVPEALRSDKGKETNLMAECQLRFQYYNNPNLLFRKAYLFGKSTRNIRIESWWSQ